MAMNKRQTSLWTKGLIILLILAFVIGILLSFVTSINMSGQQTAQQQGSTTATNTAATLASQYSGRIAANEEKLRTDPKNFDVLVDTGNAYFDWAVQSMQDVAARQSGADQPLWLAAKTYYSRALEVKSSDLSVNTDYAFVLYYSGDTTAAVDAASGVLKKDATFPQALVVTGLAYTAQGDKIKAAEAYQRYLALPADKKTDAVYVQQQLDALK